MTNSQALEIAICLDQNYIEPARTLIESMRSHHAPGLLRVWLFHEGLSAVQINQFAVQCDGWAEVHEVEVDVDLEQYFGGNDGWLPYQNRSVLFRILLPGRLRAIGLQRVLYVDCDVLCVGSLRPVARFDLNGSILGAVQDEFTPKLSSNGGIPGADVSEDAAYFNSGVLLIDIEQWDALDVEGRALSYLKSVRGRQRFYDQDALNIACDGRWLPLDRSLNTMVTDPFESHLEIALESTRLVHFVGPHKPWDSSYFSGNRRTMYNLYRNAWKARELNS